MNLLKMYSDSNYMIVNRDLAKEIGLNNSLVFGQLCSLQDAYGEGFFFTQDKLAESCCISVSTLKRSLSELIKLQLLSVEKKGSPCKNYYTITLQNISGQWSNKIAQNELTSEVKLSYPVRSNWSNIISNTIINNKELQESTSLRSEDSCNSINNNVCNTTDFLAEIKQKEKIDREYITDDEINELNRLFTLGSFNHKLPKDKNKRLTKVITQILYLLKRIEKHTFISIYDFNPEYLTDNTISLSIADKKIKSVHSFKDACDLVYKSLKVYNKLSSANYYPSNKKLLTTKLNDYLFNESVGMSWFLYCLCNDPCSADEQESKKYIINVPKAVHKVINDELDYSYAKVFKKALPSLAKSLIELNTWYTNTRKLIIKANRDKYDDFETPKLFWDAYISFIANLTKGGVPMPGHFRVYSKTHNLFLSKIQSEYKLNLDCLEEFDDDEEIM